MVSVPSPLSVTPQVLLLASDDDGEGLVVGQVGPRVGEAGAVCEVDQTIRAVWLGLEVDVGLEVVAHGQAATELLDDLASRLVDMLLLERLGRGQTGERDQDRDGQPRGRHECA